MYLDSKYITIATITLGGTMNKKTSTLTRSQLAIILGDYFVDEFGSQAAAARHIGMKPTQLNDMINCKVMITDKVACHYKNAKRVITKIDRYVVTE